MGLPEPAQIQVVALKPVSCGAFAWRRGAVPSATVVVKATFGLVPDAPARLIAPLPLAAQDTYAASGSLAEPSDMAPYLPCAGVVLWAHAHPPQPVPAMTVRLGIFRGDARLIDKSLHVFGDRAGGPASQPRPFHDVPIVYERTYGGSGFADNPAGTGAGPEARAPPNVVYPASPLMPAGFGPISRRWATRRRLAGGLDPQIIDRPGADLPDALDFRYFHPAPADQQCDFLLGDEWLVIDGMHPTLPRLSTRLPSVRAHARWGSLVSSRKDELRTMSLAADTLLVDVERRLCSLVWRGVIAIEPAAAAAGIIVYTGIEMPGFAIAWPEDAPLAGPPSTVFALPPNPGHAPGSIPGSMGSPGQGSAEGAAAAEPPLAEGPRAQPPPSKPRLGTTAPPDTMSPLTSRLPFKRASGPLPTQESEPPQTPPSSPGASQPAQARRLSWDDEGDGQTRMLSTADIEAQRARGWSAPFAMAEPGANAPAAAPSLPGAPWSGESAAPVAAREPEMETLVMSAELLEQAAHARAAQPKGDRDRPTSQPVAAPALAVEPAPIPPATPAVPEATAAAALSPPPADAPVAPATMQPEAGGAVRAAVKARLAAREPLLDLDLAGADLTDLDLAGASLGRANLSGTRLCRCKLAGARLARAQLAGADLTAADLTDADLGSADLSRAKLAKASLDGALLEQANLAGAQGQGASLRRVKAAGASFARGEWDEACFEGADAPSADFTAASLARARFEGATLVEARFADARGRGAVFDEAQLSQARFVGAAFEGASFRRADARGSVWEKATLDGACFEGASLAKANLARVSCAGASFVAADLAGANLQRIVGDAADLTRAKLPSADLRQGRLVEAKLDGATLTDLVAGKADLSRARLVRADLTRANLRGARLVGASLAHAILDQADLRDAELEGTNLFRASRATAKLGTGASGFVETDPERTEKA